jgi:hypothetical protein
MLAIAGLLAAQARPTASNWAARNRSRSIPRPLTQPGCVRFLPIRVLRASSPCRAQGLGLEQGLVPLPELGPVGMLRSPQRVAGSVLVVPSRPELALARVPALWTELGEVPLQDLPRRGPWLPSALPALERARPLLLF